MKFALEINKVHEDYFEVGEFYDILTSMKPKDWQLPFPDYVLHDILPDDPKEVISIQQRVPRFF